MPHESDIVLLKWTSNSEDLCSPILTSYASIVITSRATAAMAPVRHLGVPLFVDAFMLAVHASSVDTGKHLVYMVLTSFSPLV